MNIKKIDITPEIAESILSHNYSGNRKPKQIVVSKYADDMASGRWNENIVNPIVITKSGKLINGQHRLLAVIQSGKTISFYIQYDVDEQDFIAIDTGSSRRAKDFIESPHASDISALSARCFCCEVKGQSLSMSVCGRFNVPRGSLVYNRDLKTVRPSISSIVKYYEDNEEMLTECFHTSRKIQRNLKCSKSTAGFFVWVLKKTGRDALLNQYVADITSDSPQSKTVSATKIYFLKKIASNSSSTENGVLSDLLYSYDHYLSGCDISRFKNKGESLKYYDEKIKNIFGGNKE